MRFAPSPRWLRPLEVEVHCFEIQQFLDIITIKTVKDSATVAESFTVFREKKVENDENSKFDKFGCRCHSEFGIGAKRIYLIQRIHPKNFQV